MKKISGYIFAICMVFSMLCGCKKYEEGGLIRKTEKNLKKTWILDKYYRDSKDKTSLLLIKDYSETYDSHDAYYRNYINKNNQYISENGNWSFDKAEKKILLSGLSGMEITLTTGTGTAPHFNILKLDEEELWYYYSKEDTLHEFHFIRQ